MEDMMVVKDVQALKAKSEYHAIAKIASCEVATTKTNNEYLKGNLSCADGNISFKVWKDSNAYDVLSDVSAVAGRIVQFKSRTDEYNGSISLVIDEAILMDEKDVDESIVAAFCQSVYDVEKLKKDLTDILVANVSANGLQLVKKIFEDENLQHRFEVEQSAATHHDNVLHGLMAHTLKCILNLRNLLDVYPGLVNFEAEDDMDPVSRRDLLFIGMLIHDIDKTNEMYYGTYQPLYSFVNHRVLGTIRVSKLEDEIVSVYGQAWYMHLLALIAEHHGQYGDPIRTLFALIAHTVDNLDAQFTVVENELKDPTLTTTGPKITVSINDKKTSIDI